MKIRELLTDEEFDAAYDVMNELRTHLDRSKYLELLAEMRPNGYRMVAVEDGGAIVALAGITTSVNFYYGHYMWVYDLITTETGRSKGYGLALLQHLEQMAYDEGCETIALSSAHRRKDAHRFYEDKGGYTNSGFTFQKALGEAVTAQPIPPK